MNLHVGLKELYKTWI